MNWKEVAKITDIDNGEYKLIQIPEIASEIAIFNLNGTFVAIENRCPHQNLPLADGLIEDQTITCPFHGATFSLITGKVNDPTFCENLTVFPVKIEGGMIFLSPSPSPNATRLERREPLGEEQKETPCVWRGARGEESKR